jgi:protein-L-isoaspartate(D-aspartate) O-methyltransferase
MDAAVAGSVCQGFLNKMNAAMNIEQARFNMVEQQVRTWDVLDQDVLDLLYAVHREDFVPPAYRALAFIDMQIPLGPNAAACEHMWAPKFEARVLQELALKKTESVLEIGTGSGYFAALLAHRAQQVRSIEINPSLASLGRENLLRAKVGNVVIEQGDGSRGWSAKAPYDVIVVTSSLPIVPPEFVSQLKPGGRLFAVVGDPPVMAARLVTRAHDGSTVERDLFETCLAQLKNAMQPERFQF